VCDYAKTFLLEAPSGKLIVEGGVSHRKKVLEKLWCCRQQRFLSQIFSKKIIMLISSVFTNPILENFIAGLHCRDWFKTLVFLVLLYLLIEQRLRKYPEFMMVQVAINRRWLLSPLVRTISKESQDQSVIEVATWFPENLLALFLNCGTVRAKCTFYN